MRRSSFSGPVYLLVFPIALLSAGVGFAAASGFIAKFSTVSNVASTVPSNGDVNPYGVAIVPVSMGKLKQGQILVSNFNNSANLQGQGHTIVQIDPSGTMTTFATLTNRELDSSCLGGVGLTTALAVLKTGWVIVGSLPTSGASTTFTGAGCLIVLNSEGALERTIGGGKTHINGPWDMGIAEIGDRAYLFVSNVLDGGVTSAGGNVVNSGTIARLTLSVAGHPTLLDSVLIGSGFSERTDPDALIVGPTGVGFNIDSETLYVADTVNNRISAIPDALRRTDTAFTGLDVTANMNLNQPLGLVIAPNMDILTVNAADGNIVETTPDGAQIATYSLVANGAGALFGLAVDPAGAGIYFVNDAVNSLMLFH